VGDRGSTVVRATYTGDRGSTVVRATYSGGPR